MNKLFNKPTTPERRISVHIRATPEYRDSVNSMYKMMGHVWLLEEIRTEDDCAVLTFLLANEQQANEIQPNHPDPSPDPATEIAKWAGWPEGRDLWCNDPRMNADLWFGDFNGHAEIRTRDGIRPVKPLNDLIRERRIISSFVEELRKTLMPNRYTIEQDEYCFATATLAQRTEALLAVISGNTPRKEETPVRKTYKKGFSEAYKKGFVDGVSAFARWKDGVQYVGSGTRLEEVLEAPERIFNFKPPENFEPLEEDS